MPFQNELSEIEETIDVLSEFRIRLERENPECLAVLELTRLELRLHEQARSLRPHKDKQQGSRKKGPKAPRKASGRPDEPSGRHGSTGAIGSSPALGDGTD